MITVRIVVVVVMVATEVLQVIAINACGIMTGLFAGSGIDSGNRLLFCIGFGLQVYNSILLLERI